MTPEESIRAAVAWRSRNHGEDWATIAETWDYRSSRAARHAVERYAAEQVEPVPVTGTPEQLDESALRLRRDAYMNWADIAMRLGFGEPAAAVVAAARGAQCPVSAGLMTRLPPRWRAAAKKWNAQLAAAGVKAEPLRSLEHRPLPGLRSVA